VSSKTASRDLKDLKNDCIGLVSFRFVSVRQIEVGLCSKKVKISPEKNRLFQSTGNNIVYVIKDSSLLATTVEQQQQHQKQHQTRPDKTCGLLIGPSRRILRERERKNVKRKVV
jgi:hypothetical protein